MDAFTKKVMTVTIAIVVVLGILGVGFAYTTRADCFWPSTPMCISHGL